MTVRYLLDTDHITLLERGHLDVVAHFLAIPVNERATTIISADEQLHGRLAVIRRAKTQNDASRGYDRLRETLRFYSSVQVVSFDTASAALFEYMRRQGIRIGTQDLRIASIALSLNATVVTRNIRDFSQVPGLAIVDWSTIQPQ